MANNTRSATYVVGHRGADYVAWQTFTLTHIDYPKGDVFAKVGFFVHLAADGLQINQSKFLIRLIMICNLFYLDISNHAAMVMN